MMHLQRLRHAARAAAWHGLLTFAVGLMAAGLVFGLWFPAPFHRMVGGTELFWLLWAVDVVCGPLLTLVLFNPAKSRRELCLDLGLVVLLQLSALVYGLWTVWQARPLYVVHELDRVKVISRADLGHAPLAQLPVDLQPGFFKGPQWLSLRDPLDEEERKKVLFESVMGGPDYAERPEFYLPWSDAAAAKTLLRAKKMDAFLRRYPERAGDAQRLADLSRQPLADMRYLPVKARKDWIAVLTPQGHLAGYLEGDGF
jgi:hypothetical protein